MIFIYFLLDLIIVNVTPFSSYFICYELGDNKGIVMFFFYLFYIILYRCYSIYFVIVFLLYIFFHLFPSKYQNLLCFLLLSFFTMSNLLDFFISFIVYLIGIWIISVLKYS